MGSIPDMDNKLEDQKFLDGVTAVLNYDSQPDLANYKWRISGSKDLTFAKKELRYTSFIDLFDHEL